MSVCSARPRPGSQTSRHPGWHQVHSAFPVVSRLWSDKSLAKTSTRGTSLLKIPLLLFCNKGEGFSLACSNRLNTRKYPGTWCQQHIRNAAPNGRNVKLPKQCRSQVLDRSCQRQEGQRRPPGKKPVMLLCFRCVHATEDTIICRRLAFTWHGLDLKMYPTCHTQ